LSIQNANVNSYKEKNEKVIKKTQDAKKSFGQNVKRAYEVATSDEHKEIESDAIPYTQVVK